jgi:glycosyltransferase involved in cell wall biosynthesis
VDTLLSALERIQDLDWEITFVATGNPALRKQFESLLALPRVRSMDFVPRDQLARVMSRHDVFVFPSLAEGSARVVFEALACGCFVITTPNAGSIVGDGVHGLLVKPGDVDDLERAIRRVLAMDRLEIARIGSANADVVKDSYRQQHYGDTVLGLYEQLLESQRGVESS